MLTRSCASKRKGEDAGLVQGSNADAEFPSELEGIRSPEPPEAVPRELPTRNFNDFSADVILMIFKYLDTDDIASSVLPVCKTWYDLGRNPILWKVIKKEGHLTPSRENHLIAVIQRSRLLRSLTLSLSWETWEVSSILECVARSCPLLSTLHLISCTVNCNHAVQLLVSSCPSLKRLILTFVFGSALMEFAELTTLVELEVNLPKDMDGFLMRLSMNSRQLETVRLVSKKLCNDEQLVPLLTNLSSVLKRIYLEDSHCRSQTYRAVAECSHLQSFELCSPDHFTALDLKALQKLKKLKKICFGYASHGYQDIGPDDWKSFISNVCSDYIECVSFDWCRYLKEILEGLLTSRDDTILHRAKTVGLCHVGGISDHVVKLILTRNPFLENLSLRGSSGFKGRAFNTTDTSVAPALRRLDVSYCSQVCLRFLRTFLNDRPALTIRALNGLMLRSKRALDKGELTKTHAKAPVVMEPHYCNASCLSLDKDSQQIS